MKFIEALTASLPNEISIENLQILVTKEKWQQNPEMAAIQCLRIWGKFDINDYLERYPDVAQAKLDPIQHFVKQGIYEKRNFRCLPAINYGYSKVHFAHEYFLQKDYTNALWLYEELAEQIGKNYFATNIAICKKNIDHNIQRKKISVIIPVYNAEKTIARALDSIINQTLSSIEIIIYDDCSTDKTVKIIKKYQQSVDIRLFESKRNVGQGKGRNIALQYASGQYVTFLDADDYYQDNTFLNHLLDEAVAEHADIVVTPYLRQKNGKLTNDSLVEGVMTGREAARKYLSRDFGTHAPGGKLFRTYIARSCSFVEFGYSQDVLFCFKALRMAQRVCASSRHGYVYENDTVSSWRPVQLTELHFFSSLRLLTEICAEIWESSTDFDYFSNALRDFMAIWRTDHAPRLATYLAEHNGEESLRHITSAFDGIGSLLLQVLGNLCPALYGPIPTQSKIYQQVTPAAIDYARSCANTAVRALKRAGIEKGFTHDKELLVIYVSHLSSGGLERVAAQWSTALANQYDILYLLDAPDQISYSYTGRIMKADLFDPAVIYALDQAVFIVDFKYKKPDKEYPICLYCLDHYAFKYIVTVHNTKTCGDYVQKIKEYLGTRDWNSLYAIICVSEAIKNIFEQSYGPCSKVEVIPNPVDFDAIKAAPEFDTIDRPFVLFAGRLNATQHKGLDILLKAWAASSIRTKCHLVLAGGGKIDTAIRELLKSPALAGSVEITGFQKNIYGLMKKALFVVVPSRWEGFSMTIIESLACSTPVLATKVGGAAEVIRDGVNGLLIPVEDVEATTKGLEYLFSHAEDMEGNCRLSVQDLSLSQYRQQLLYLLYDQHRKKNFPKSNGHFKYSIVSACYNVELYLDDFFQSIVDQSIHFEKHIQCIMVDDGSTDNTATIIKNWQTKYPNNIYYFYQKNSGQGCARNLGIRYVQTPWVTFTDPDDFLDINYFKYIDDFLNKEDNIYIISAKIIRYYEDKKIYLDNHPLNFKFKNKINIFNIKDLDKYIQLSMSSAFFRSEFIHKKNIYINENIKPCFEDAHFIARYLINSKDKKIVFMRDLKYFYRKRKDSSSTLDKLFFDKNYYTIPLKYGCISLLEINKNINLDFIKYMVMYHCIWLLKRLLNYPSQINILTKLDKDNCFNLIKICFSYIDDKTILKFNLAGVWFYHKVGILYCFKNKDIQNWYGQIVYIEDYDAYKDEILVRYFIGNIESEVFYIDNNKIIPNYSKIQKDIFLEHTFVLTRYLWLPLKSKNGKLSAIINGQKTRITLSKKQYLNGVDIKNIREIFKEKIDICKNTPNAPWLFMDREIQADDNAEHLYRYVMQHHPEHKIYFVLRRDSHDWNRLYKEGFNLLAYGSKLHEFILRSCSKIISSQIDYYITNYFGDNSLNCKQFIWLQHGVIKDDLSTWLNKKRLNIFLTTTQKEFESIVQDYSRYKFTTKEVKLCGLPRHDALITANKCKTGNILIMPTWRHYLMGEQINHGNIRKKNPNFMQSKYAQSWSSFLNSNELRNIHFKYSIEFIFFPHSNIQPYLDEFKIPNYINIMKHSNSSIQQLFLQSDLMITDYSSVAFEMAFLFKPIIYYQFDEKEFFSSHTYDKGYFDYRKQGFGPVVTDENQLLYILKNIIKNKFKQEYIYIERIKNTFLFRDGKNCDRVYHIIKELEHTN